MCRSNTAIRDKSRIDKLSAFTYLHQKLRQRQQEDKERRPDLGKLSVPLFREVVKYWESSNQLEVLNISLNFLNTSQVQVLVEALPPQIKELNLSYNNSTDVAINKLCDKLENNYSLISLNL